MIIIPIKIINNIKISVIIDTPVATIPRTITSTPLEMLYKIT